MKSKIYNKMLLNEEDQFSKFFFNSPIPVGITTLKGGYYLEVNQSFVRFCGYKHKEIIGHSSFELKFWLDNTLRDKAVNKLRTNGKVEAWEVQFRIKSGAIREILSSFQPITLRDSKEAALLFMFQDISELKNTQEALKVSQDVLEEQKVILEQKNLALREVISHVEVEKDRIKKDVVANIELLMPLFDKIKIEKGSQQVLLKLVKDGLDNIVSSFGNVITQQSYKLTSREIEVCNMIKRGLPTKEIARTLHLSSQTIEKHRKNIRRKLGLSNNSINLFTYLKSIK